MHRSGGQDDHLLCSVGGLTDRSKARRRTTSDVVVTQRLCLFAMLRISHTDCGNRSRRAGSDDVSRCRTTRRPWLRACVVRARLEPSTHHDHHSNDDHHRVPALRCHRRVRVAPACDFAPGERRRYVARAPDEASGQGLTSRADQGSTDSARVTPIPRFARDGNEIRGRDATGVRFQNAIMHANAGHPMSTVIDAPPTSDAPTRGKPVHSRGDRRLERAACESNSMGVARNDDHASRGARRRFVRQLSRCRGRRGDGESRSGRGPSVCSEADVPSGPAIHRGASRLIRAGASGVGPALLRRHRLVG